MHSRIYQTSTTPIDRDDYIDEGHYYDHWFTNSVADYVNGDTNRDDDIEWLQNCYGDKGLSFGRDDNGEYFIVEDKTKYFESNFVKFQNELKELSKKTLEDFMIGERNMLFYRIKELYNDEFGFYVQDDFCGCSTFDSFMRYATVGTKYYIGATIDYHF